MPRNSWPVLAIKETAKELCLPLYILFTKSLQSSSVPEVWKQAFVTPIYKKGERCKAENYCLINLTSTIGKILESIIRDQIYQHLPLMISLFTINTSLHLVDHVQLNYFMPWTIGLPHLTIIFQWISFIWIFVKLSTQSLIVVFLLS